MKRIIAALAFVMLTGVCEGAAKYEWDSIVCAPKDYPMEIHRGAFYSTEESLALPGGQYNQGWGATIGRFMVVGPDLKTVPEHLRVTWLSLAENKFYTGDFLLDKEKILALFREGAVDHFTKKKESRATFIVGLAPGGVVVVWMNMIGSVTEVGRFSARETELAWKDFNPDGIQDRDRYVRRSLESSDESTRKSASDTVSTRLKKNGISFGRWDEYRKRFNMKPVVEFVDGKGAKTESIYMEFYNGETDYLFDQRLTRLDHAPRARLRKIDIAWKVGNKVHGVETTFDEDDAALFRAYEKAWQGSPEQPGELMMLVNLRNNTLEVSFRNGDRKVLLGSGAIPKNYQPLR